MSLSSKLSTQIDLLLQEFCEKLSKKYNLSKTELYSLWNNQAQPSSEVTEEKKDEMTVEKVSTSTKDFLMAYCKSKGLKQSGTKDEVVKRVLEYLDKNKISKSQIMSTETSCWFIFKYIENLGSRWKFAISINIL